MVGLLIIFMGMQFLQPDKNNTDVIMTNDIATVVNVPDTVKSLLQTACYDCHSNNTNYPWYSNIQPVGWWLNDHIKDGKRHLNFQEFALMKIKPNGKYKTVAALQDHKLEEVAETVTEKEMPMESYTWIHKAADLTEDQRRLIINWVDSARAELKRKTPLLASK